MASGLTNSLRDILTKESVLIESALPFILIFTIVFAVLQKTQVIGEGRKQFNFVISLILSLMVVIPHITQAPYPGGKDIVTIINTAIPQVSILIVAILVGLLLIGVFAPGVMFGGTGVGTIMGLASMGAVIYIFGNAAGFWKGSGAFGFLNDPDTQAVIVIVLVFAIIIAFIVGEGTESGPGNDFWKNIGKAFGANR